MMLRFAAQNHQQTIALRRLVLPQQAQMVIPTDATDTIPVSAHLRQVNPTRVELQVSKPVPNGIHPSYFAMRGLRVYGGNRVQLEPLDQGGMPSYTIPAGQPDTTGGTLRGVLDHFIAKPTVATQRTMDWPSGYEQEGFR
jgi:hypothetical protein